MTSQNVLFWPVMAKRSSTLDSSFGVFDQQSVGFDIDSLSEEKGFDQEFSRVGCLQIAPQRLVNILCK